MAPVMRDRPLNRIPPKMSSQSYRTFAIRQSLNTHYRKLRCEDAECEAYANGWTYPLAIITPDMWDAIRRSGKTYRRIRLTESDEYVAFNPGQQCFQSPHVVSLERPAFFYSGRGDYRTFSLRTATQFRPSDWVECMQEHCDTLRTALERG